MNMKRLLIAAIAVFTTINSFAYYNPNQGRWLSRDPIQEHSFQKQNEHLAKVAIAQRKQQASVKEENASQAHFSCLDEYSFVGNSPMNSTDLLGLTENCKQCGPDITSWLIDRLNQNRNHPVIRVSREVAWPNWVPVFNIGWNYGFFTDFRDLVKAGAPWDFKSSVSFKTKNCPSKDCPNTVTLCGLCVDYDVPGNIHYGYVGKAGSIRRWFLLNRASAAQVGGKDPDHDVAAVTIGMDLWDGSNQDICSVVRKFKGRLNYGANDKAKDCKPCKEPLCGPTDLGW